MKILMLGWELPPHNSGGLGVACYQLCNALANKGAQIEFILPYTADHSVDFMNIRAAHPQDIVDIIKSGIAYDSYQYVHSDGRVEWVDMFSQHAMYEVAVGQIVENLEFDVIHAHDWLTFRAALRAREISGKPLIAHVHSIESDRSGKEFSGNPLVREIEETTLLLADRVISISDHTRRAIIREYGIPAEKIDVVHNSFDRDLLIPENGENAYQYLSYMKGQGYKVVASIGRLTIQKGLPNLLQAFHIVVKHNPKALLLMVGAGEQYYELINLAAQLGISKNVIFTDFQRGKGYRDAFAVADLFVMPSISEPFGLTPLEAIGYGTPALISKQSGVAEVIRNCLKVDFWDINEMANQMVSILRHTSLRDELHANAAREYERMSWNNAADNLLSTYERHTAGALA